MSNLILGKFALENLYFNTPVVVSNSTRGKRAFHDQDGTLISVEVNEAGISFEIRKGPREKLLNQVKRPTK